MMKKFEDCRAEDEILTLSVKGVGFVDRNKSILEKQEFITGTFDNFLEKLNKKLKNRVKYLVKRHITETNHIDDERDNIVLNFNDIFMDDSILNEMKKILD